MTSYSYPIVMNDGERIAFAAAMELMIRECEGKLAAGEGAPWWAYKQHCESMLKMVREVEPRIRSMTIRTPKL